MPTIVQSRSAAQISTLAFSSNVSAGNLLVVCFTTESSLTGVSIADTLGTSYSVAITTSGNTTVRMYYGSAPSSGANTVTFSGGSPTFPSIALTEISGAQPVLDGTPVGAGSGATSPGSLTTTFANSIAVVGLGGFSSLAVWTPPSGWTIPTQTWAAGLAYTVEVSPGTLTPTFGGTNIVFATLVMVAFKAFPFPLFSPTNMTADNAPSPYIASASDVRFGYTAHAAFGGNPTGSPWDSDTISSSSTPTYLQIDIGAGHEHSLSNYAVQAGFSLPNQASAWLVQGSNDLVRWTTLDSQTAQTAWSAGEIRLYALGSTSAAYRYYRLYITAVNSGGNGTMIGQLYLYGATGTPITGDPDFAPHDLTSNTSHSPFVVSASSHAVSTYSYDSFLAFDGNLTVAPAEWTSTTPAAWIQLDLGSGILKALTSYGVAGGFQGFPNRTPKNWTMQGSLDGATWVVLDTQVNQTNWNLQWAVPEIRIYTVSSAVGYRYFRLNITANNGDTGSTGVFQIYLFGYTPVVPGSGLITTAKGTLLKISNVASPAVYVSIGKVRSISGPTTKPKTPDITTHDAPGYWARKLAVLIDGGEANFEVNFDQSDATHSFTTGMWHQLIGLLKSGFQIVFPNGAGTLTFKGYIGQHEFDAPVDNVLSAKIMIAITDDIIAAIP